MDFQVSLSLKQVHVVKCLERILMTSNLVRKSPSQPLNSLHESE